MKKALIFGVCGQDGSYLSKFLIKKKYLVYGTTRSNIDKFNNLDFLSIRPEINLFQLQTFNLQSIFDLINYVKPDEIYNLSAQSSVNISFQKPIETFESNVILVLNILESVRQLKINCKIFFAGSSEVYGNTNFMLNGAVESTKFNPNSPYSSSKVTSFLIVDNYRKEYNIFATTGILFNHESPLRGPSFVTKKIISTACRIKNGSDEILSLGDIDIFRDFGWAPEYVEAMWLMLQQNTPVDLIIATGKATSIKYFLEKTFDLLDLDLEGKLFVDKTLFRVNQCVYSKGNPEKAKITIDWCTKINVDEIISKMIEEELKR